MTSRAFDCCILNSGNGAWAFDGLASQLSRSLAIPVKETPCDYNYVLFHDDPAHVRGTWFIPHRAIVNASDKRLLAGLFTQHHVPTPATHLVENPEDLASFLMSKNGTQWCLKYPLASGAFGHRLLTADAKIPPDWPRPIIVQEFIPLERPEVYRTYGANGGVFGWVARRFPAGSKSSPWVAHARGARYEAAGSLPPPAAEAAELALRASGLLDSFGCVDLLQRPTGEWVVLEVGTDGIFNHVDRELNDPHLEVEINRRIACSFWAKSSRQEFGA